VLLGIGLLAAGSALGMYATNQLAWGSAATAAEARQVSGQVRQSWERDRPRQDARPTPGQTIALLRIPRLGPTYEVAIVEGVGDEAVGRGLVGHVPGTAFPGQAGNFAAIGYRVTHGEPFRQLGRLQAGDPIVVETPDTTYTYVVVTGRTVAGPDQAMLTLATRASVWNAQQHLVVFARLATSSPEQAR
jgi:sortase A